MLKLYHGIPSVCSIKARIALAEIGLEYESIALNLQAGEQSNPEYLELNPNGVVPTLVDGDLVVIESSLIIEYLDRAYNGGALMPKERDKEVSTRLWLLRCIDIHAAINTLSFSTVMRTNILANTSPEGIETMLARMPNSAARMKRAEILEKGLGSAYLQHACQIMKSCFTDMDAALTGTDWVCGPEFGLSDIALISYVDRLERLGFEGLYNVEFPRVAEWLARMQSRESYKVEVRDKISSAFADKIRSSGAIFAADVQAAYEAA